jgi:hypothetical protein
VRNSPWKRVWTSRKTDYVIMMMMRRRRRRRKRRRRIN